MKTTFQKQHFVSQVLLRRFAIDGFLQAFDIATEKWNRVSPKKLFVHEGYTQMLADGQVDNSLEDEFGKVERKLPVSLKALDDASQRPSTILPLEVYTNLCWYCAFLWRISPFAKAKAPVDFVYQLNMDLEKGKTDLLKQVIGLSDNDIDIIKKEHAQGKKVIIDSQDFLQLIYRVQFTLRCKEDYVLFRHFTKWTVYNSPIELPISDIALVQVSLNKTIFWVLPISPFRLLVGTIKEGEQHKSDETIVYGDTFTMEEAEFWQRAICLSAQATLAGEDIIPDVMAKREKAATEVNYTKIVNPKTIISAGITDFTGAFGVRLATNDEWVKFVNSFVAKEPKPINKIIQTTTNNQKVGNKEVVAQERYILRSGENAEFDLWDNGTALHVILCFSVVPPRPPTMGEATWEGIPNGVKITFKVSATSPVIIKGSSSLGKFEDGGKLEFYAEIYRYAENNVIFIQLMKNKE